jgi:hypothetical protein
MFSRHQQLGKKYSKRWVWPLPSLGRYICTRPLCPAFGIGPENASTSTEPELFQDSTNKSLMPSAVITEFRSHHILNEDSNCAQKAQPFSACAFKSGIHPWCGTSNSLSWRKISHCSKIKRENSQSRDSNDEAERSNTSVEVALRLLLSMRLNESLIPISKGSSSISSVTWFCRYENDSGNQIAPPYLSEIRWWTMK